MDRCAKQLRLLDHHNQRYDLDGAKYGRLYLWSRSTKSSNYANAYVFVLEYNKTRAYVDSYKKMRGFGVRCIKNSN